MTSNLIGLPADEAQRLLEAQGFTVTLLEYASPRGVEDADSSRVIRVRELGNNSVEITVARFKTRV
jgi:hypothetical protein